MKKVNCPVLNAMLIALVAVGGMALYFNNSDGVSGAYNYDQEYSDSQGEVLPNPDNWCVQGERLTLNSLSLETLGMEYHKGRMFQSRFCHLTAVSEWMRADYYLDNNALQSIRNKRHLHGEGCITYLMTATHQKTETCFTGDAAIAANAGLCPLPTSWQATCTQLPAGLTASWSGDNSGQAAVGGRALDGRLQGGAFAEGMKGQAFDFTHGGYVEVQTTPDVQPATITVDAWVNLNRNVHYGTIVKQTGRADIMGYALEMDYLGDKPCFWIYAGGKWTGACSEYSIENGNFNHVAGTYDGSAVKIYVNGKLANSAQTTGEIAYENGQLQIGRDQNNPGREFSGMIDEIHIFNRALGQTEIASLTDACGATSTPAATPTRPTAPAIPAQPTIPSATPSQSTTPIPVAAPSSQSPSFLPIDISSWFNQPHSNAFPESNGGYKNWFNSPQQIVSSTPYSVKVRGAPLSTSFNVPFKVKIDEGNDVAAFQRFGSDAKSISLNGKIISAVYLLHACGYGCGGDQTGKVRVHTTSGQVVEKTFPLLEWSNSLQDIFPSFSFGSSSNPAFQGNIYFDAITLERSVAVDRIEIVDEADGLQIVVAALTVKTEGAAAAEPTPTPTQPSTSLTGTPSYVTHLPGLISLWQAEENTKDFFNRNDGAPQGSLSYADGKVGRAFSFDGETAMVKLPNIIKKDGAPFTIATWFYVPSDRGLANFDTLYSTGGCDGSYGFHTAFEDDKRLYFDRECVTGIVYPINEYSKDAWHFGVAVYDGSKARIYLDGVPDTDWVEASAQSGAEADDSIGGISNQAYSFKGRLDDVMVFNRALTDDEISKAYAAYSQILFIR